MNKWDKLPTSTGEFTGFLNVCRPLDAHLRPTVSSIGLWGRRDGKGHSRWPKWTGCQQIRAENQNLRKFEGQIFWIDKSVRSMGASTSILRAAQDNFEVE